MRRARPILAATGLALSLAIALALAGCATPAPTRSTYDGLGGTPGIEAIVEDLLWRILEDARINRHFADADIPRLHRLLVEQICAEAGGPCVYSGESMEASHAGRQITEAEFNALVEHLVDAMEARKVPVAAQNRLLARLAPMRGDIIRR